MRCHSDQLEWQIIKIDIENLISHLIQPSLFQSKETKEAFDLTNDFCQEYFDAF
jgi:hypothetical protein